MTVRTVGSFDDDQPELFVSTVRFTVTASHDLLTRAELFGLVSAQDTSAVNFPGMTPVKVCVTQARKDARASFHATGFEAATVTAMSILASFAPPATTFRKEETRFVIHRPFGFLAVHRSTNLVLFAGWVTEPDRHDEE